MENIKIVFVLFLIATIFYAQDGVKTPSFAHKIHEQKLNKNPQVLNNLSGRMLDSVITTASSGGYRNPQYKYTFTYNSTGSLATWLTQTAYGAQENTALLTYEYNSDNKITSRLHENWDVGQWVYVRRETYTYDSLTTKLTEKWDGNKWVNHTREIKIKSYRTVGENWDWNLNEWVKSWSNTESGDPLVSTTDYWMQNEWVNGSKTTYTYDYKDNLVPDLIERGGGNEWHPYMAHEYSKSSNDDTTFALAYQWESSSSQYLRYKRQTYVYLGYNYVQNYISYCMNETFNKFNDKWEDGITHFKFIDSYGNLFSFQTYRADFYYSITTTDVADESISISNFSLSQNYPNPFNPSTIISFELPHKSEVNLAIYNTLGQVVAILINEVKQAGQHQIVFDASDLPNGVYIYRIKAGSYTSAKKMVLLK